MRYSLDVDQREALRRFHEDAAAVLVASDPSIESWRAVRGLTSAYRAALVTGNWQLFVPILTEVLYELKDTVHAATAAYRRLRAIIEENLDLLPEDMLSLAPHGGWSFSSAG